MEVSRCIVYQITNLINNKIYVGIHITENVNDGYMGSGKLIAAAIKKYGLENFKKEILFEFDNPEDMIRKERELVDKTFVSRIDTYNLTLGGGSFYYVNSKKLNNSAEKSAEFNQRLKVPEYKEWFSTQIKIGQRYSNVRYDHFKGKLHSNETKSKIGKINSINQSGIGNSQYGTCWICNIELKQNKKIVKGDDIPHGWILGRRIKF